MNQDDIYKICEDEDVLFGFLQTSKLLSDQKVCLKCNCALKICKIKERYFFYCKRCRSRTTCTPKGLFLHNVRLKYNTCLKLMFLFLVNVRSTQIQKILGLSKRTVIDWYNFCREVCFLDIKSRIKKIGGYGKHVEIDESVFGKRKYNKGRFRDGQWVIGGIERESGECFFETIERRDSKSLLEVIKRNVELHTTIITDEWKGYKGLENQTLSTFDGQPFQRICKSENWSTYEHN